MFSTGVPTVSANCDQMQFALTVGVIADNLMDMGSHMAMKAR